MSYIRPLIYEEFDSTSSLENWFLYWKISPSLWEEKLVTLSNLNFKKPIWVPLFWGLHHLDSKKLDFGEKLPEANIFELQKIAIKNNITLLFMLFVNPCPLFPRGGIPQFVETVLSLDNDGIGISAVESGGQINKIMSFFGPKVFKNFRDFIDGIRTKVKEENIPFKVVGVRSFYFSNGKIISYFLDNSNLYNTHFQKYLDIKKQENNKDIEDSNKLGGIQKNGNDFFKIIENLYVKYVEETLREYLTGMVKVGFVGGAPLDIFERASNSWNYSSRFYPVFMHFIERGFIPTTVLLDPKVKSDGIGEIHNSIVDKNFISGHIDGISLYDTDNSEWLPYFNFILFDKEGLDESFYNLGLLDYLKKNFKYEFRVLDQISTFEEAYDVDKKIYFARGEGLDESVFKTLLKIFFSGGKVVIDKENLPKNLEKYLMRFLIENSLKVQKVSYLTEILQTKIGEGILLVFSGAEIRKNSAVKKTSFWENLFNYLSVKKMLIVSDDDIFYHIKFRGPISGEYDFHEIRNIKLWNSSSYKKNVKIKFDCKTFKFRKCGTIRNVEFKEKEDSIEVMFLPKGEINLNFGLLL